MTELWSNGRTYEHIKDWETKHLAHSVFYLFEDIQVLNKRIAELEKERDSLLRLISYARSIVFSKAKCGYASFKRPLEELLKDQGNG